MPTGKIFVLTALLFSILILVLCNTNTYEIAIITDTGDIDDGSFNQGTWEGIGEYATTNNISHKYYRPAGESVDDYVAAIDLAVTGGAKIVITPGYYFEVPIFQAQSRYPEVTFVIIDGTPNDGSAVEQRTLDNQFYAKQFAMIYDILHSHKNPKKAKMTLSKFVLKEGDLNDSDKEKLSKQTIDINKVENQNDN